MLEEILTLIQTPYWPKWDVWVSIILAVLGILVSAVGVYYSYHARAEAEGAKRAANRAATAVKIQGDTVILSEIRQDLARLTPTINYDKARRLLTRANGRLREDHRATTRTPTAGRYYPISR